MDVIDAILTRRSIRKYEEGEVTQEQLHTILKAGCHAPSAHNRQPWHFIVIKDKNQFEKIAQFHTYAKMLYAADICIVVCGDTEKQTMTGFLIEDCSAAIQNMLLAAHGLGLGAVWCGLYPVTQLTGDMRKVLSIPAEIIPVGMIVIGKKGEERIVEDRYDAAKIHYEKW